MYFSATIFQILGFSNPTLTSLSVALTNFAMTCVALLLIDRVGRRRILIWSIPLMSVGLFCCSIGFSFITLPQDNNPTTEKASNKQRLAPSFVLASIMLYVAAYALGLGNVPWSEWLSRLLVSLSPIVELPPHPATLLMNTDPSFVVQSELFPLNVRSLGSGISTSTNWGANFIVGLTFLPMMELLTPTWTFVVYAIVCIGGWLCIWRIYPETKGLSLEEIGHLLANGWGVKESLHRLRA